MRLALYARVSTRDKDQNPETQLLPLREYAQNQEGIVVSEYVDHAPTTDLNHRIAGHRLMDDARLHKIDVILVWRMDRAKREGKTLGRPRITENPGRSRQVTQAIQAVQSGSLSYRKAAHQYGFSVSVLQRAMKKSRQHTEPDYHR